MEIPDGHFRHILLHYFQKSKNAVQARKKLYDVYGEKSLTERQCHYWFYRFRSGDSDLKDAPRSGRPTEVDDDKVKAMIENNRHSTTREIAEKLNISHTCVERHLKQLGYVNKLDIQSSAYQDNARPHTSLVTRKKLLKLDWEVMPYPPYSPDLASSVLSKMS